MLCRKEEIYSNFNFAGINKRLAIVKLLQNWVGFEFELAQFF